MEGEDIKNKMEHILTDLLNSYKNNGKFSVLNPYAFFVEQRIFIKLDKTGKISELEKSFLIDYMKEGIMTDMEILEYEELRRKHPSIMLPEVDF